jgi:RNA polymerase sigma factor (TIGR02999 family)
VPSIPELLTAVERGDAAASDALFSALYSELHRVARRELARPGAPMSVGATTLLHEAYLEMAGRDGKVFPDQARFIGYAARVMRGLVIDHVRGRKAIKRGGQFEITSLDTELAENLPDDRVLTQISQALDTLARTDAPLAEIVDLKFFCGFSFAEIAALHGTSERTVQRQWEKARIYLHRTLRDES